MKRILIVLVILLLCGCSSQYSLNIEKDKITEKIIFPIDKAKIVDEEIGPYVSLYSRETINSLVENDIYVEIDSTDYVYNKDIDEDDNQMIFTLTHDYIENDLENSRVLNECFENKEIEVTDDKISIHLSGKYTCLVEDNDSVEFKITTANKIESSSAEYNFLTNEFIWKIDKSNADNVNIELTVLTQTKLEYYAIRGGIIAAIICVIAFGAFYGYKFTKREKVNEI